MDVISTCPLRVGSIVWRPKPEGWVLTVVCKATYRLEPVESPLADVQEGINEEDNYWNDDESRSLYAPSDLAPYKPRADVMLVGHAFAPNGQPVRSLMTRLLVGEVDKSIEVWCDRGFGQDGRLLEGPRFVKMSLRYERAAGGPETSNPIGMRFDARPDAYGMVAIPNLQPPGVHVRWRGDTFVPIGYGPVAPTWPSRVKKLYRHAAAWSPAWWRERPLPADFDPGYFNAAPPDQQIESLRWNERIVLENLHPDHGRLVTNLSGVRPRAEVERARGSREVVPLACDTLWIDTNRGLCTLAWRGHVTLSHAREFGRVTVSAEQSERAAARGGVALKPPGGLVDPARTLEFGELGFDLAAKPVMPFKEGPSDPAAGSSQAHSAGAPPQAAFNAVLIETPPLALKATTTDTIQLSGVSTAPTRDVLPFQDRAGEQSGSPDGGRATEAGAAPLLVADVGWERPVKPIESSDVRGDEEVGGPALEMRRGSAEAELPGLPEAPPMIGPLAYAVGMEQVERPPRNDAPEAPAPAAQAMQEQLSPKREPRDVPLEGCAAITASIARRLAESERILNKNNLTKDEWSGIAKYWTELIQKEASRGKTALMKRFDAAYVKQLEAERGPIQTSDYARLVVASERGTVDDALTELDLPGGALMRIERYWMELMSKDPALAERVQEAVESARGD